MEFDWRYESRDLLVDTTKVVRAIEKMTSEELAFRKSLGDDWKIHEDADLILSGGPWGSRF